jgi:hypothetical protein
MGKLHARASEPDAALAAFEAATQRAQAELSGAAQWRFLGETAFERGRVLDHLDRHEEAYRMFVHGNEAFRAYHRMQRGDIGNDGSRVAGLSDDALLDAAVARARREGAPSEAPVFIVGFPRSGTTLLDQMLDAHPGLQVMEERPALEAVVAELGRTPRGYPHALLDLNAADREALRNIYWQRVGRYLQRRPGTRLVDKSPLAFTRLHLGLCLFPDAKWVFALRHPCDVVLSCFMQPLRHTPATHGFYSIAQTAAVYVQLMGLWLGQRARLRPDCLDLRYEELVEDLTGNARRLVAFLDLPWDDAVLRYRERAQTRRINTPSYAQVVQPIYRGAAGRWRRYRPWFGAAETQLAPFVSALGYPATDESGNSAGNSGTKDA